MSTSTSQERFFVSEGDLDPEELEAYAAMRPVVFTTVGYTVALIGIFLMLMIVMEDVNPSFLFILWILVAASAPLVLIQVRRRVARKIYSLYKYPEPVRVAELTESRREIVAAFEIERRRIERDLHDGAQQYLVTASMGVGEVALVLDSIMGADESESRRLATARQLLAKAQDDSEAALAALRHTVAGIHPKVLSDLGLEAAVRGLAADSPLEVNVRVPHVLPPMPEGVIAAGYFLVAEALTNVAKYAGDAVVSVLLAADDDLRITVVDNGPGGAEIRPDHGLAGLRERLAAFGGSLVVVSPHGGPTSVVGRIPLLLRSGEFGIAQDPHKDSHQGATSSPHATPAVLNIPTNFTSREERSL